MARIQILPLPPVKVGEYEQIPFILILDQIADDEVWDDGLFLTALKHETGAVSIIGHHGTLVAPGALTLTDEQQADLLTYLTQPRRWVSDQTYTDTDVKLIPGAISSAATAP